MAVVTANREKGRSPERKLMVQTKKKISKVQSEINDLDKKIAALNSKSKRFVGPLGSDVYSMMERLIRRWGHNALVPVQGEYCGGCHILLPSQKLNSLKLGFGPIVCDQCARLLYMPDTEGRKAD